MGGISQDLFATTNTLHQSYWIQYLIVEDLAEEQPALDTNC
jgi:hypothetical protein